MKAGVADPRLAVDRIFLRGRSVPISVACQRPSE